jgi:hypothetical protein
MKFVKGMIIGVTLGTIMGMAVGAMNCDSLYGAVKAGKKEIKRFKRKYCC